MENNYQSLTYSNEEKVMTYVKAIIKAVNTTHKVNTISEMKSRKIREVIKSKDKELMWSTLQEYICHYFDYIRQSNKIMLYAVDAEYYDNITVAHIERQLNIMIGIVYDYEAKHCVKNEVIKKCLESILKRSGIFTDKEIELLIL